MTVTSHTLTQSRAGALLNLRQCEFYVKAKSRLIPYNVTLQWLLNLTTCINSKKNSFFQRIWHVRRS